MNEHTQALPPNRIPAATVRRWAIRAFVPGPGMAAAVAALLT